MGGDKMKDYQFEEITFWFSLIACLLAYHFNIIWMQGILSMVCVFNLISMIVTAWEYVKKEINNQSKNESGNQEEES